MRLARRSVSLSVSSTNGCTVSPSLEEVREEAQRVVADLAATYRADPSRLPQSWQLGGDAVQQIRTIGDFVAGMTDRFAIARHEEMVGASESPG